MTLETALLATAGGVLIGLSSAAMMVFNGRIAGISGIFNGVINPVRGDFTWKFAFIFGMVVAGIAMFFVTPEAFPTELPRSTGAIIVAGLLVGFGTRLGSGCTSGHGVCGMSRFSPRSIVATLTFMFTGAVTVAIVRHLLGGTI